MDHDERDLTLAIEQDGSLTLAQLVARAVETLRSTTTQEDREAVLIRQRLGNDPVLAQTTLDSHLHPLDGVLEDIEHGTTFLEFAFFTRYLWPRGMVLREGHSDFVDYVANQLGPLVGKGWMRGCLFTMPTGAGKSIAIDYLSVRAAATHISDGRNHIANSTVILAVPTVALAQEAYQRLYDRWYAYGAEVLATGVELHRAPMMKIAAMHGERKIPLVPIKLLAGSSDVQGIVVRASRNASAEAGEAVAGTKGTFDIVYVAVCTYEHALQLVQSHAQPMPMPYTGNVGEHLAAVVFDEAHYITESTRTAAMALHAWVRMVDIPTVYMTGTPSDRFKALFPADFPRVSVGTVRKSPLTLSILVGGITIPELWTNLQKPLMSQVFGWHANP
jgi:hypothetical protein